MKNAFWKLCFWFWIFYFIQGVLNSYRTYEERYLTIRYGKTLTEYATSQNLFSAAWFIKARLFLSLPESSGPKALLPDGCMRLQVYHAAGIIAFHFAACLWLAHR